MDERREELLKLKTYTEEIDNELTMILQTLQWDRKHLLQTPAPVTCRYDSNHKVPPDKTEEHEKECFLRQNGYSKEDQLLPDPFDSESNTLVKLKKEDIEKIIADASRSDQLFKKVHSNIVQRYDHLILFAFFLNQGVGCREAEPLSLERLQISYSADERRAIHDAVVSSVPSCHDLTDLALLSGDGDKSSKVILSRQQILLELRNMRRRRAKYRVAAKSRNYSDVLRDVIRTQMEHYNEAKSGIEPKETVERGNNQKDKHNDWKQSRPAYKDDKSRYDGKIVPKPIQIKIEREDSTERNRDYSRGRSDRANRYEMGSRDRRDRDSDRRGRDVRSRERRHDDDVEKRLHYGEHSRKRRHDNETRESRNYYHESKDKRRDNDPDKEYSIEKRSKRSHRHKEYDPEYRVKIELGSDEDENYHRATSRERRHDEKRDKVHKNKDKKERRRDRERSRSREKRRDNRYEEGSSERACVKQEREYSFTRDETNTYGNNKAKDRRSKSNGRRGDRSYRDDRNYDVHSLAVKHEKDDRYYDGPSEEIYDPNKRIKLEK